MRSGVRKIHERCIHLPEKLAEGLKKLGIMGMHIDKKRAWKKCEQPDKTYGPVIDSLTSE
jgi:hypothetical protein